MNGKVDGCAFGVCVEWGMKCQCHNEPLVDTYRDDFALESGKELHLDQAGLEGMFRGCGFFWGGPATQEHTEQHA